MTDTTAPMEMFATIRTKRVVDHIPANCRGTVVHVYGDGKAAEVEFTIGHKTYVEMIQFEDMEQQ